MLSLSLYVQSHSMKVLGSFSQPHDFFPVSPIPTGHGQNQPIYECHVTAAGRNRVKGEIQSIYWKIFDQQ